VGESVKLRFTLRDDGRNSTVSGSSCTSDGWYIDDIEIREVQ
jgi:hypothetical protein